MKFDHKKIEEKLRVFWRERKEKLHYYLDGKVVQPESVSSCSFQLDEIESLDGYNFEVTALNLRVQINSLEASYKATFTIKVEPQITTENNLPEEEIIGILNERVTLRK